MNREFSSIPKISDFLLLKDKVYEAIKKSIIDLSLLPNEQLVEQRLADNLGVSKSPIREALQRLEKEGLVYTLPFKGCFVAEVSKKDILGVFQLREALETFCVKHACETSSTREIQRARNILLEGEKALERGDTDSWYAGNIKFHHFFISQSQNERIIRAYSTLSDHLSRYWNIAIRILDRATKSHPEHILIIEAVEQKNAIQAEKRMSDHLRCVLKELLQSKELKSFCSN